MSGNNVRSAKNSGPNSSPVADCNITPLRGSRSDASRTCTSESIVFSYWHTLSAFLRVGEGRRSWPMIEAGQLDALLTPIDVSAAIKDLSEQRAAYWTSVAIRNGTSLV